MFNGTLKDLGNLEYAAHGVDVTNRPHKDEEERQKSRQERRAEARKGKKKKLTVPEK